MNNIKERFLEILNVNRIKFVVLAKEMDVASSSVSRTLNLGESINKTSYFVALQKLTNCNLNWVISGIGDKYLPKENYQNLTQEVHHSVAAEPQAPYQGVTDIKYQEVLDQMQEIREQLDGLAKSVKKDK